MRLSFFFLSLCGGLFSFSLATLILFICFYESLFLCFCGVWRSLCFLNGPFTASFSLFSSFQQLTVNMFIINFTIGWIRTTDLWYWKRPLCQLSHNQCPQRSLSFSLIRTLFLCLSLVRSLSISLPPFCLTELVPNS